MWGLIVIVVVGAWTLISVAPPAPVLDEMADPSLFSAGRVLQTLRLLDPDETPHPVGSDAHARVRERLLAQMVNLGLEYEVQQAFACRPGATCASVHNVMARLPGPLEGPAIMISAHYDSVHAGPGAADDLHGVGLALEVARALIADGTRRNPVLLLVTDAEEVGLLGARAFVDGHPWAEDVAVVLNVEARGSRGRSSMFETHEGNAPLMRSYFDTVDHPAASSLAYEVYRRMPNDTDFTVFKSAEMAGLNFAFIGGVAHYHTPLDDRAHLSAASVQHQGEQVLAVARDLDGRDLGSLHGEDAAYTDVAGTFMVHWPVSANLPIAIVLGLGWIGIAVVGVRRRITTVRRLAMGAAAMLGMVVAGIAVSFVADWGITYASAHPTPWYADPLPHRVALWSSAAVGTLAVAHLFPRRIEPVSLGVAVWGLFIVLAVVSAVVVPGATPLWVLPGAFGVLGLGVRVLVPERPWRDPVALLLPLAITTVVWLPLSLAFEEAFGFRIAVAVALPIVLIVLAWAPWWCGRDEEPGQYPRFVVAAVVVVAMVMAVLADPYSEDAPRRLNVLHHTDVETSSGWIVVGPGDEALPSAMLQAASFDDAQASVLPWSTGTSWTADASPNDATPPTLEIESTRSNANGRHVVLRVRSQRNADRLLVLFPADAVIGGVTVHDQRFGLEDLPERWADRRGVLVFGPPAEGVRIELDVGSDTVPVQLVDFAPQLPAAAAAVRDARGPLAVPTQWGDGSSIAIRTEI